MTDLDSDEFVREFQDPLSLSFQSLYQSPGWRTVCHEPVGTMVRARRHEVDGWTYPVISLTNSKSNAGRYRHHDSDIILVQE